MLSERNVWYIAHLPQQCHNSKFVIFQEKLLKVLKCYNFLWVQRRHNCSPAASFANCVMTLYPLKVHLQTFLSVPITQKCQILSCDTLVANEQHIYIYIYISFLIVTSLWKDITHGFHTELQTAVCNLQKGPQEMASEMRCKHSVSFWSTLNGKVVSLLPHYKSWTRPQHYNAVRMPACRPRDVL
jgi:hypothetical protein